MVRNNKRQSSGKKKYCSGSDSDSDFRNDQENRVNNSRMKPAAAPKRKKANKKTASSSEQQSKNSNTIVQKLEQLRAFCGSDWNETDLCTCLRQCGYNVELAAEKLITGQFKATPRRDGPSLFTKMTTASPTTSSRPKKPPPPAAAATKKPKATTTTTTTTTSTPATTRNNYITPKAKRQPAKRQLAAATTSSTMNTSDDDDDVIILSDSSSCSNSNSSHHKRQRRMVTPHASSLSSQQQQQQQHQQLLQQEEEDHEKYLLCQRWLTCACMTRNGKMDYKETFHIESATTGAPIIRFRGTHHNLEGTLPRTLSAILAPLFRHQQQQQTKSNNTVVPTQILSIDAHALMSETNVPIGGDIPISLSVYIHNPRYFFNVAFDDTKKDKSTNSSLFFNTKQSSNGKSSSTVTLYNKNKLLPLSEAAFALLQWAEYGQLPEFQKQAEIAQQQQQQQQEGESNDATNTDPEALKSLSNALNNFGNADNTTDGGEGDATKPSATLTEMDDPAGFQSKNIQLRPYQRQALYWMMKREQQIQNNAPNNEDEELEKQLSLLAELATTTTQKKSKPPNEEDMILLHGGDDELVTIQCDCGPVQVSPKAARLSKCLENNSTKNQHHHHPLWQRRYMATENKQETITFYINELLHIATYKLPQPPKQCLGGILADSMGLGKTVMLLALIMKSKELLVEREQGTATTQPTLVVAPLSLIAQWEEELETKTHLSYHVHYSALNDNSAASSRHYENFDHLDVVVTTYGTVQAEYQKWTAQQKEAFSNNKKKSSHTSSFVLNHTNWGRIILDEAHTIKNHSTIVSKACSSLDAPYRWCVTGTIIQNSLDDIYALLKFLRHEPWCEYNFWKISISSLLMQQQQILESQKDSTNKKSNNSEGPAPKNLMSIAMDRMKRLLSPLMLRRTKDTLSKDGKPILVLPPIENKVVPIKFTKLEKEFYEGLLHKSQDVFEGLIQKGTANKAWFTIFSLLHRLRQACDHITLTVKKREGNLSSIDSDCNDMREDGGRKKKKRDNDVVDNYENETGRAVTTPNDEDDTSDKEGISESFIEALLNKFRSGQEREQQKLILQEDGQPLAEEGSTSETTTAEETGLSQSYLSTVAHTLNDLIAKNATQLDEECPLCLEFPKISDAALAPCAHNFCQKCLVDCLANQMQHNVTKASSIRKLNGVCPVCNSKVDSSKIVVLKNDGNEKYRPVYLTDIGTNDIGNKTPPNGESTTNKIRQNGSAHARITACGSSNGSTNAAKSTFMTSTSFMTSTRNAKSVLHNALANRTGSSKLDAIMNELHEVWKVDPGSKVLIFSQFLGFLDIIGDALEGEEIPYNRLDGKLTIKERIKVLENFKNQSGRGNHEEGNGEAQTGSDDSSKLETGSVLLISMKAGGVGLNLVAASTVFIVDPWWNASVEDQCINRIHRIGQTASVVRVRKFIVTDSVEERIVELQHKKKNMANEILCDEGHSAESANNSNALTMDDYKLMLGRQYKRDANVFNKV